MGDTDTRMSPGLCLLACLRPSMLTPWGDSQPQLLSLLPFCIERLNNASQSLKVHFIPLSFVGITPPSFYEMYKMTGSIDCKKHFRNSGRSACDPQGCFKKDKRTYCCCLPVCVTALRHQLLFRFTAEWHIVDNHEHTEMLHAACIKALQLAYIMWNPCSRDHHFYWIRFSWWEAPSDVFFFMYHFNQSELIFLSLWMKWFGKGLHRLADVQCFIRNLKSS